MARYDKVPRFTLPFFLFSQAKAPSNRSVFLLKSVLPSLTLADEVVPENVGGEEQPSVDANATRLFPTQIGRLLPNLYSELFVCLVYN